MTITEEILEKLFYKLESKGCLHKGSGVTYDIEKGKRYYTLCGCPTGKNPNLANPSWEDFGWMITRAKKAEWWDEFIDWVHYHREGDVAVMISLLELIDPTAFRDALINYFGLGGERDE